MIRNIIPGTIILALALGGAGARSMALAQLSTAQPEGSDEPTHVKAGLMADVTALVPGRRFHLGVNFQIAPKWHIYWRYSGESGRPTEVKWVLPEGFKAGPLIYPAPHRFVDAGDIVSFGHEGQALLWSEVTPPKTLEPGGKVTLSADVEWLACKTLCVIGSKKVSVVLPVVASAKQVKPANAAVFEAARRQTPVPPDRAEHVQVRTGLNVDRVRPSDRFEVGVHLAIDRGWHIQSHQPLDQGLIGTDLFLAPPEVISLHRPVFPPGKIRQVLGQKVSEYHGQVTIRVPARATADLKPGRLHVDGVLVFQTCSDEGTCLPPLYVAVRVPVKAASAGASVRPANAEWFAGSAGPPPGPETGRPRAAAEPTTRADQPAMISKVGSPEIPRPSAGLGILLLMALAGGLVLNVMPCVLPVVSIKIVSFVQQAGEEPRRVLILGLSFALGMLLFFLGLGLLAMAVQIGPGWVLQRPAGVIVLTAVIFGFALSLFGVFEVRLPGSAAARLGAAGTREGPLGAMAKGFLTTVLGTSCTAPFLSFAWAGAMTASPAVRVLIFGTMGVGMASPYLILSAKPGWLRFVPRPGPWMEGFKQFMGFFLVATALWLLWVLAAHVGGDGVVLALGFLTALSLGLWIIGRIPPTAGSARWLATHAVALGIVLLGGGVLRAKMAALPTGETDMGTSSRTDSPSTALDYSKSIPWQPYRPGLAEKIAASGKIAYVDYTARWCPTCQSNKRLVLETEEVRAAMRRLGVVPIKADFTRGDPQIKKDLARFHRPSVPLNLVYPPSRPDAPIVLPEVLTRGRVLRALERAASAKSRAAVPAAKPVPGP